MSGRKAGGWECYGEDVADKLTLGDYLMAIFSLTGLVVVGVLLFYYLR